MKAIVTDCRFYNGTTQFARQLYYALRNIGEEAKLFLPDGGDDDLKKAKDPNVVFYDLYGSYFKRQLKAKKLAKALNSDSAIDYVFFADDGIYNRPMQLLIKNKKTAFFVQDPKIHTLKLTIKQKLMWMKRQRERRRCFRKADKVIILSQNSKKQLISSFPKIPLNKIFVFPLGPHPANVQPKKPLELGDFNEDYLLFFGSIEKYKNHAGFLEMFNGCATNLVIAGAGVLDERSHAIINANRNIKLINRFISDEEMTWLFGSPHCRGNLLPYTDATQSGVLVMGYHFGVPAIVSTDPGLCEFVEEGITGFVCQNKEDYMRAIKAVFSKSLKQNCLAYCEKHLSYESNWRVLLDTLGLRQS